MTYLALIVGAYAVTVITLHRTVHLRVWNDFGMIDVVVMVCLVLPFMIAPWFDRIRPRLGVTRYAWFISAVMALDVLFFVLGILGPFGSGHPSLEALGSYFLGLAKPVLVPATLVLLVPFQLDRANP
jgi:quinol-cytochrome oxidoreductase complex cytochrome b subunit